MTASFDDGTTDVESYAPWQLSLSPEDEGEDLLFTGSCRVRAKVKSATVLSLQVPVICPSFQTQDCTFTDRISSGSVTLEGDQLDVKTEGRTTFVCSDGTGGWKVSRAFRGTRL